jgi:hypothetical protein
MATNTPIEDLRRGGTHRERYLKLQAELRAFSEGAVPEEYEEILHRFLTDFERLRLETEAQIMKLQKELSFCEGTHRSCITIANTLVSVIRRYREDLKRGVPETPVEEKKEETNGGNGIRTDTEVLKTICVCGCQDEEDAADCNCSCHKGVPCDREDCIVCQTKKEQLKAAATKKKTLPRKKAPAKKKVAKKKATRKKTTKKTR